MNRCYVAVLVISVSLFSHSGRIAAQPSVTNVDGAASHGGQLVVTGSAFGTKNPAAPLWWDDMEGAPDGHAALTSGELSWVISSTHAGSDKHYSEANPSSGSETLAYMTYRAAGFRNVSGPHSFSSRYATGAHWQFANNTPEYCNSTYQNVVLTVDSGAADKNKWFAHWYYRVDPQWTAINDWENHKKSAPNYGTTIYDSPNCYMSTSSGESEGTVDTDTVVLQLAMLGGSCNPVAGIVEHPGPNARLDWVAYEQIWDSPAGIHEVWRWNGGPTSGISTHMTAHPPECQNLKNNTRSFSLGGWYCTNTNLIESEKRGGQDNFRYFDDVYVDTTWSRVVLANNQTYENATIVEPQIPSTWSDASISATVNLGRLSASSTLYLFVFDADGNHNATGFPLVAGTSDGGPSVDSAPADLGVDSAPVADAAPDAAADAPPDAPVDAPLPDAPLPDTPQPDAPGCPDEQTLCGESCVDTQLDPSHCGSCNSACGTFRLCEGGSCVCSTGLTDCGDCVDTDSDATHCGGCNQSCATSQVCNLGTCSTTCQSGLTVCGQDCVDVKTSIAHCGGCDQTCVLPNSSTTCKEAGCEIDECHPGFHDLDGQAENGCEYACKKSASETEICNDEDDDCNGEVDDGVRCDAGAASDGPASSDSSRRAEGDSGCGCEVAADQQTATLILLFVVLAAFRRRF